MLGGTPALVIFNSQLHLVLAKHGLGALNRALVALEALLERLEGLELLVSPPGERRVRRHRTRFRGRPHARLVLLDRTILLGCGEADDQAHPVALELLPKRVRGGRIRRGQAHTDGTEAKPPAMLQDIEASRAVPVREPRRLGPHVAECGALRVRSAAGDGHPCHSCPGASQHLSSCHS